MLNNILQFRRRPSPPAAGHASGSRTAPSSGSRGEALGFMLIIVTVAERFAAVRGPLATARFLEQLAATYREDARLNPEPPKEPQQ